MDKLNLNTGTSPHNAYAHFADSRNTKATHSTEFLYTASTLISIDFMILKIFGIKVECRRSHIMYPIVG